MEKQKENIINWHKITLQLGDTLLGLGMYRNYQPQPPCLREKGSRTVDARQRNFINVLLDDQQNENRTTAMVAGGKLQPRKGPLE